MAHLTASLRDFIDKNSDPDYILMGDFNFPDIEWRVDPRDLPPLLPFNVPNEYQCDFLRTLSSLGFEQYNTVINGNNRYLDLVFSTLEVTTTRCALRMTREDMPNIQLLI